MTIQAITESDSRLAAAVDRITTVMGFRPKYEIVLDEQGQILQVVSRTKTVQVGQRMKQKIYANAINGDEILIGLLAHEVAHIMQLQQDCYINLFSEINGGEFLKSASCFKSWVYENGDISPLELHADFMAGWAMARLSLLTIDRFEGFAKDLFEKGDYYVGQPGAHGTPRERLNAMANGYFFGVNGELLGFYANQYMKGRTVDRFSPESAFDAGQATLAAWL